MAESIKLKAAKWDLKTAKSVSGRKKMSIKKKNEWKRKARVLEKFVSQEQKKEDRRNKMHKNY